MASHMPGLWAQQQLPQPGLVPQFDDRAAVLLLPGLPALPPLRTGPSMLAGMHSTHRSSVYPCSAAAFRADRKTPRSGAAGSRPTPRTKYFACQIVTRPRRSPTMTSIPQSPGLAKTRFASPQVARTSRPSICSKSSLAPAKPARAWCTAKLIIGSSDTGKPVPSRPPAHAVPRQHPKTTTDCRPSQPKPRNPRTPISKPQAEITTGRYIST